MLIPQVTNVNVIKTSTSPLKLEIHATGTVPTTGWTNPKLTPVATEPGDPVLDFNFEATPPTGPAGDVVLPITASTAVEPGHAVSAVTVISRTNRITVYASQFSGGTFTTHIAGEEQPTSLVAGEEHFTTLVVGEEHQLTTLIFGEEHPTTQAIGEESATNPQLDDPASSKMTTMALGEEQGPFGGF